MAAFQSTAVFSSTLHGAPDQPYFTNGETETQGSFRDLHGLHMPLAAGLSGELGSYSLHIPPPASPLPTSQGGGTWALIWI